MSEGVNDGPTASEGLSMPTRATAVGRVNVSDVFGFYGWRLLDKTSTVKRRALLDLILTCPVE
ncbi:MAG: hypothetical protein ACPGQS_00930 [Bradymonadia bacterium]